MRIAVIGAGVAGITAAYRLRQAGHGVEILEALDVVGGRTRTAHFGPGHYLDTGAAWLASFYTRTLALFDDLGLHDRLLAPRTAREVDSLLLHWQVRRFPFSRAAIAASALLTTSEKQALTTYLSRLAVEQSGDLRADPARDDHDAVAEFAPLGSGVVDYVIRPSFEGPFFTPLKSISAAMARAWLRAMQGAAFYQVAGGMDSPWRDLAAGVEVRPGTRVAAVRRQSGAIEVVDQAGARRYDGVVLAVPAPEARTLLSADPELAPSWLGEVQYVPAVRVYAARPSPVDATYGVHVPQPHMVASVEFYAGRRGGWGACPPDWQWGLVTASSEASPTLLDGPAAKATEELWTAGRAALPELFPLEQAEVVQLVRWPLALPVMAPGRYRRLAAFRQRPPVVLAGDWTQEACVEGAVRSGEAAAAAFGAS
ncbi:MAG TPA: NAD(P)/FAD-dependent oxidoreductase [Chloroflexota bacterium]|nr:NAD(P)/FAD-dependent oxidoreductase [Chloroflexota bacterium]